MDNIKNDAYYIQKIRQDLEFIVIHMQDIGIQELNENEILLDSMLFRMIQLSENAKRLSEEYKQERKRIPWNAIYGLRNRIVHDYGNVALATDEGVDFVLAIGDADTAGFARELARRMAALDAGEDGFVPYGCIVSEGKVPAVVGTGEVPVFAIIAPELLEGIGSPLRELLGSVCAAA